MSDNVIHTASILIRDAMKTANMLMDALTHSIIRTCFDWPITCKILIFNAKKGHHIILVINICNNPIEEDHLEVSNTIIKGSAHIKSNPITKNVSNEVTWIVFKKLLRNVIGPSCI